MALPSGAYIIENVHNRNWAILTNDNDGDDVLSGTDADTNSGHKVERLLIFCSVTVDELIPLFSGRSGNYTTEHISFAINNFAIMQATSSRTTSMTKPRFSALEPAIPNVGASISPRDFTGACLRTSL
jgi:hypothetical protein